MSIHKVSVDMPVEDMGTIRVICPDERIRTYRGIKQNGKIYALPLNADFVF